MLMLQLGCNHLRGGRNEDVSSRLEIVVTDEIVGKTVDTIVKATGAELLVPADVPEMQLPA